MKHVITNNEVDAFIVLNVNYDSASALISLQLASPSENKTIKP